MEQGTTEDRSLRKWYLVQTIVILAGTVFAWYTVVTDFLRFYHYEGTLFKVRDCVVPNPVVTPCFYGALAFILALALSIQVLRKEENRTTIQRYLTWLLGAGTLFAAGNFTLTMVRYIQSNATGESFIACSGIPAATPLTTPCFFGLIFYAAAFMVALSIIRKRKLAADATQLPTMPLPKKTSAQP